MSILVQKLSPADIEDLAAYSIEISVGKIPGQQVRLAATPAPA